MTSLPAVHADSSGAQPAGRELPLRFRERVRQRLGSTELLVFRLGEERFAIELRAVDEIVDSPVLRPVAGSPAGLLGVFPMQERILPLHSPAAILGAEPSGNPVALVMRWGRERIALAVDDADDIVTIDLNQLRDAPSHGNDDEVVAAVMWRGPDLVTVLDARALLGACVGLSATRP